MLRIQSLAKITFEIDENFTPVLQSQIRKSNPKTSVTSLDKRDRQSLFPEPAKPIRDIADHVSLSSLFNCQITDGQYRPSLLQSSKIPEPRSAQFSPASQGNPRASSSAARSAAALVR
ncbi:hypothetical protein MNR02_16950 [Shinella sp. H4-D48]|uniref:hypothetical protein n=1 Tax=Shinella sp. H4-D48 TaxID=2925841 RepID=UPI001F535A69|nr:hypothetical protein [Shinella sp. H4-D48]UNK37535.1 hypothetical protein MNR02_13825 [Shinella sp. H4-D48]UNK38105.1 hypothetical protein MNR02_16950 [Shinella sp. H4-D48]